MSDELKILLDDGESGVSAKALQGLYDNALSFLEIETESDEDKESWRVTEVSMNSPLTITFFRPIKDRNSAAEKLLRLLLILSNNQPIPDNLDFKQADKIEKIAKIADKVGRKITMQSSIGKEINIESQWATDIRMWAKEKAAKEAIPKQYYSIAGRLEGVNVHGNKSEFYVYDSLTNNKMRCLFDDDMLEKVKVSLDKRVQVSGNTIFNADDIPIRMEVDTLDVIESQPFLEKLKDAQKRGIMNLTGGLTIDDAVSEVRYGSN